MSTEHSIRSLSGSTFDRIETTSTQRYPSITDYYVANSTTSAIPFQLQPGLSNFSSLKFGDDRILSSESIISESFRIPVEEKLRVKSPSKNKPVTARKRDYEDAKSKISEEEIDRLERVMKDKLIQRATLTQHQVRGTFKFFDRDQTQRTTIEGFTRTLELLGFQFSGIQNLVLFARYDPDYTGTIDYNNFVTKAMVSLHS